MKRIQTLLLGALLFASAGMAQVVFKFSPNTVPDGAPASAMEGRVSMLLTLLDDAGRNGRQPDLSLLQGISPDSKQRILAQWDILPYVIDDDDIVCKCLQDVQGYQIRNIPIVMKPKDNSYEGSRYRFLTVSLDKKGIITGVRPALELHSDVDSIMRNGRDVEDITRRQEILKFVEDFRNYYNERNLTSLEKIFSEDALIITGSVIMKAERQGDKAQQVVAKTNYKVQDKQTYLRNLDAVFKRNRYINVKFDRISVARHSVRENIYGVTLHQTWESSGYRDEGWLFLLWDFTDPVEPKIHVRTWQPNQSAALDGTFSLDDFFIP